MKDGLSRTRRFLYMLVPYLLVAGVFVVAEIGVRIAGTSLSDLELFTGPALQDKVELVHGQQVFEGDALLGWKLRSDLHDVNWDFTTFSTNQRGLRYYKDVNAKSERTVRVVSLGDSVTFGYRVPTAWNDAPLNYNRDDVPFTVLLEKKLNESKPGKSIEVIPLAVPGYTTAQGLKWFARDVGRLRPDLTIILFGWNDTEFHPAADKDVLPDSTFGLLARKVVAKSQILIRVSTWLRAVRYGAKNQAPTLSSLVSRVSSEDFVANVLQIARLAKTYGSEVLVMGTLLRDSETIPEQSQRIRGYRERLKAAVVDAGFAYLEIDELTERGWPANKELFGELIHPNAAGHRLMAERIIETITKENLLGRP